ncbi:MAG: EscU/YscU/HrcU family type III secretion system export apparatus switch protein [Rhodospirillales bacterium]|nr:EscU/YscU/HrcU family type III secretion system export apparatus switch protein [Rhodospirillales bacterium]
MAVAENDKDSGKEAARRLLAVALSYDPDVAEAPRVVASGRGELAERIVAVAEANGVAVREDADLAQVLCAVDVDSVIPIEAFAAVAEILAYVYRVNNRQVPQKRKDDR